jgi:hypothetical protein
LYLLSLCDGNLIGLSLNWRKLVDAGLACDGARELPFRKGKGGKVLISILGHDLASPRDAIFANLPHFERLETVLLSIGTKNKNRGTVFSREPQSALEHARIERKHLQRRGSAGRGSSNRSRWGAFEKKEEEKKKKKKKKKKKIFKT